MVSSAGRNCTPYPDLKNARDVGHREPPGVTIGGTAASGAGGSDKRLSPAQAIKPARIALREEGPEKGRSHRRLRGSRASRCTVAGRLRKRGSRQLRPRQTARQALQEFAGLGFFGIKSREARGVCYEECDDDCDPILRDGGGVA